MNEVSTPRHICPKCGKKYEWRMMEDIIRELVVFTFYCRECDAKDSLAISRREYIEWAIEREKEKKDETD